MLSKSLKAQSAPTGPFRLVSHFRFVPNPGTQAAPHSSTILERDQRPRWGGEGLTPKVF